jgi:hypothetical protein
MNTIYVIAEEVWSGYEEDSIKPKFVTEVCYNLGFWDNETSAKLVCTAMNAAEDDGEESEPYYVLAIDKAKTIPKP